MICRKYNCIKNMVPDPPLYEGDFIYRGIATGLTFIKKTGKMVFKQEISRNTGMIRRFDMGQKTLKEIVYNEMLKAIMNGQYTSGQVLNEQTLIDQFGYSKSPIREALIMLCNEGILRNIPRYGYEIVQLTANDVTEILAYRQILECGLLRYCFSNITDHQLDQLRAAQKSCYPMTSDGLSRWDNNQNFHMVLASFSNNSYAYKQLLATMKILRIAFSQKSWSLWENYTKDAGVDPHNTIIEGIETKNLVKAEEALRNDLLRLK